MKNKVISLTAMIYAAMRIPATILVLVVAASCATDTYDNDVYPNPPFEPDSGTYTAGSNYDSLHSYPGGGGIFVFYICPSSDFTGDVNMRLIADQRLMAGLSRWRLTRADTVAEIILSPVSYIPPGDYTIKLVMTHHRMVKTHQFLVRVYDWYGLFDQTATAKLDQFKTWLLQKDPVLNAIYNIPEMHYFTYPEILIVEHHTFLTPLYEVRLCYHVMVPPHDWSMILIRKRNCTQPVLAARRGTDGSIQEIGIQEYPVMFGY